MPLPAPGYERGAGDVCIGRVLCVRVSHAHTIATGRTYDPVAPTTVSGKQTKRNS